MRHLNLILLTTIFLIACQDKKKEEITHLVSEWQGKEIVFPDNLVFTSFGTDTVNYKIPHTDHKVLIYVDSIGCTSCKLQLKQWKKMIHYTDSITGKQLPYLFFFHSKDYKEILYSLKQDQFDLPVCFDINDQLNKLNQFPADITFQTFLLDKENKVVMIGSPIHNLAVKELYIKQIGGEESTSHKITKTIVEIDTTTINIGTINKSETRQVIFSLKNKGNNPLVIFDTSTTCGCVIPSFDKYPANPGNSLHINVKITPKESGFFNETITVKSNTEQSIKFNITGKVR